MTSFVSLLAQRIAGVCAALFLLLSIMESETALSAANRSACVTGI